jgi:hypothetical protein
MRRVKVKVLTTNGLQVLGNLALTVPLESYRTKISALLNNSRSFIEVTEVEVYEHGQLTVSMPSLYINKPAIACLFEEKFAQSSSVVGDGLRSQSSACLLGN